MTAMTVDEARAALEQAAAHGRKVRIDYTTGGRAFGRVKANERYPGAYMLLKQHNSTNGFGIPKDCLTAVSGPLD
jgi:hypothetical protein